MPAAEEKRYDVNAVKERLGAYWKLEREIENQQERLERITSKMTEAGAQVLTDMPRSPNSANSTIDDLLSQKEELEAEIEGMLSEKREERKRIEALVKHIPHPDERAVVLMRYIDHAPWNDIAFMLFGGRADFNRKAETYLRRSHRVHGSALLNLARYLEGSELDGRTTIKNPYI